MLKKTIKYVDFNDIEREEDFYFNLSKTELLHISQGRNGDFLNYLRSIINSKSISNIYDIFVDIILKSYGKRSDDGRSFIKSQEQSDLFKHSPAFDELVFELLSDSEKAAEFINGIVPKSISEKLENDPDVKKEMEKLRKNS